MLTNASHLNVQSAQKQRLFLAVMASLLLHLGVLFLMPNLKFDAPKKPEALTVALEKKPEPSKSPEPPKEPEPKPAPKPEVRPKIKPETPKPVVKNEPVPTATEPPPPPKEVIAVAPKPDTPAPVEHVAPPPPPPPPPPKEPDFSQADVDAALGEYGGTIGRAISKYKTYPKIAQMRGWQGDVILDVKLDGHGKVVVAQVQSSSGFEALDKQALEMVRKAAPFPVPPEALRNRTFNITVPVSFKLTEE